VELVRVEEGTAPETFRLVGELDISNVAGVRGRLLHELRRVGNLTLDVKELHFIGVDGLRMLMELGEEGERRGTSITLLNCSSMLRRLLDVMVADGIPGVDVRTSS
jgi:anti-anti-sigma factor